MWIAVAVVALGLVAWGPIVSNVEEPNYQIVRLEGNIEIRDYPPLLVAQTEVQGPREDAISQGFRIIADYIFGNNSAAQGIAMTAPVTQQASSQKIAMTAPVMQTGADKSWQVRFVMPAEYTRDTLPTPNNPAVKIVEIPAQRFAVIRFSGTSSTSNIDSNREKLMAFVKKENLQTSASPTLAFYNPPWTLPFLRRNEIMVPVK